MRPRLRTIPRYALAFAAAAAACVCAWRSLELETGRLAARGWSKSWERAFGSEAEDRGLRRALGPLAAPGLALRAAGPELEVLVYRGSFEREPVDWLHDIQSLRMLLHPKRVLEIAVFIEGYEAGREDLDDGVWVLDMRPEDEITLERHFERVRSERGFRILRWRG